MWAHRVQTRGESALAWCEYARQGENQLDLQRTCLAFPELDDPAQNSVHQSYTIRILLPDPHRFPSPCQQKYRLPVLAIARVGGERHADDGVLRLSRRLFLRPACELHALLA